MITTVTAADRLSFRLCTGPCLLGLEEQCICRCHGRWHGVLTSAEIPIPPELTLAEALSGGPAKIPARRTHMRRAKGPEAAAIAVWQAIEQGRPLPSARALARAHRIGRARASDVRAAVLAEADGHGGAPHQLTST